MKKRNLHIVQVFLMLCSISYPQQYTNYSIKDGLPSNRVYRLTQDKEGFIWAITDKGMAKFDGSEFKIFNTRNGLPTNDIWDIRVDGQNRVWYFSKSSKLGYIKNDSVHSFSSCIGNEVLYPAYTNLYNGTVLLGSNTDWFYFNGKCWQKIPEKAHASPKNFLKRHYKNRNIHTTSFFEDFTLKRSRNQDSIIFTMYAEGYSVINDNTGQVYNRKYKQVAGESNPFFLRNHYVNGQVQLTGFDFVAILDDRFNMETVVKIPTELKAYFSMVDRSGNVWSATFTQGIYKLPQICREIKYELAGNKVDMLSKVGNKIVANVYNKGFYEYKPLEKKFVPLLTDKSFTYNAVYIDSLKSYFFNSESQNIKMDETGIKTKVSNEILAIRDLVFYEGFLYGINSGGMDQFHPETFEQLNQYQMYGMVDILEFDKQLLFATSKGIHLFKDEKIVPLEAKKEMFQKPLLSLQNVGNGLLLANTDGYGSYITDLKSVWPMPGSDFLSVDYAYTRDNEIWLATEVGVMHYKKENGSYEFYNKIDDTDGLPSKKVNSLVVCGDDLVVGTDNGAAIFPINVKKKQQFLALNFNEAKYNETPITTQNNEFPYQKGNTVNFTVAAIDYSINNTKFSYEYILLPTQEKWIATQSRSLNFSDLQPGSYTLGVRAHNIEKKMQFSIAPLWWQRPISKISFALLGMLLVLLVLYKIRNHEIAKKTKNINSQKQLAEFQLYALRSQLNPHFVSNSLAAIQYYINNNDFDQSEKYLVKFSKLIRRYFELSKEEEISLEDEIALLKSYLEIEKLRFKEKLNYTIEVDGSLNIKTVKMPTMLLQPVVENAVNHGIFNKMAPGTVTITFKYMDDKQFRIEIKDDGVGICHTENRKRMKMKSSSVLKDRLFFLNQSLGWKIDHKNKMAYPDRDDKGNISIFTIKRIK